MKKIVWSPILFIPAAGLILFAIGFNATFEGEDPSLYFMGGVIVIAIGVFLYSRIAQKKQGDIKLVIRRKKNP